MDSATARADQLQAQAREQADQKRGLAFTDDLGPHLVPGDGPSVWRQNVALIQSSQVELDQLYAAEIDGEPQLVVRTGPDRLPATMQKGSTVRQAA